MDAVVRTVVGQPYRPARGDTEASSEDDPFLPLGFEAARFLRADIRTGAPW